MSNFWIIIKGELLNINSILRILFIGFLYIAFTVYLPNYRFILSTLFGNYELIYKLKILFFALGSLFTAFPTLDFIMIIITGLLIGINLILLLNNSRISDKTRSKIFVGSGGVLGIATAGCTSCGLSILSMIGLGTSLSFLPFSIKFLYILSILALLFSAYYMINSILNIKYCRLKT